MDAEKSSPNLYVRTVVQTFTTLKFHMNHTESVESRDNLWCQTLAVHILNSKLKLSNLRIAQCPQTSDCTEESVQSVE